MQVQERKIAELKGGVDTEHVLWQVRVVFLQAPTAS